MQREEAARNIAELAQLARQRLDSLDSEAISLAAVARTQASSRNGLFSEPPVLLSCKSVKAMRKLAQTWILMKCVHESLLAGEKQTQRELWYKLKPSGLFSSAEEVFERVLDVCAVITQHAGVPCPREALGVISTSKGAVTGAVSIAQDGGTLALDQSVHLLSGDPEVCSALRFSESRARCILVVEKDTVFNRLFDDGFVRRLPCLLVTAKGFPDLATRAFVRRAIDVLQVPCFAFTDHNPYGLAVMLTYKHSSATFAIERYKCPEMVWIGLGCADVARMLQQEEDGEYQHQAATSPLACAFQRFSARDFSLLQGLATRPEVEEDARILCEVEAMQHDQRKLEIEALRCRGPQAIADFLVEKIIVQGSF